ncbi:sensor domain-containing diguanylate cyclase [uncultured Pseudodesulfovibrio sp.]|uniref:sensor domain-containing diguanylate cyclase n=1 Tax=uncultured Pseudodesulfovibrio sp. TaxID=2035858 RepID=UPI0029C7E64E|nr:sensor domain-containing diguanylate cyclase [uncultured Pseudodesulfovibrio sp.]
MIQEIITIDEKKAVRKAINLFLLLFLLFGCTVGGLVAIYYQAQLTTKISKIKEDQAAAVALKKNDIDHVFDDVTSDLLFLTNQNEMKEYLATKQLQYLRMIANEYLELAANKSNYAQIRFLDINGVEKVRIDNDNGKHFIVSSANLQDKSNRYYLKLSRSLKPGEVYISPLDLNVEDDVIERPFKPMIRFSSPVFDSAGLKKGFIIINYYAQTMIDSIRDSLKQDAAIPMLVNKDGYWLLSENSDNDWGFMIPERKNRSFSNSYPDEWLQIVNSELGQLSTEKGMFSYAKVYPFKRYLSPSETNIGGRSIDGYTTDNYWVLVTFVPHSVLWAISSVLQIELFLLGAGLFLFISLVAWFLALAITKRKIYQSRLISMALYDELTGLANRKLFYERLGNSLELAERYGRRLGLLYIDLDGFKQINDNLGHHSGDDLLVNFSQILKSIVRKTDTVARMGGDEFAVVLTEVESIEDAGLVANKIIDRLSLPIKTEGGYVNIGASIGVAVFPDTSRDLKDLVRLADASMYKSKKSGKNVVTMAKN